MTAKKAFEWFLKWLPEIAFAVILGVVVGLSHRSGFQTAYNEQQAVIEKMKADAREQEAEAAKQHAAQLEKIHSLTQEMNRIKGDIEARALNMTAENARRKAQNKKGIEHAIKRDKNENRAADECLGAHSLRQYRQSLGYGD